VLLYPRKRKKSVKRELVELKAEELKEEETRGPRPRLLVEGRLSAAY
jgi:hypothetical protein